MPKKGQEGYEKMQSLDILKITFSYNIFIPRNYRKHTRNLLRKIETEPKPVLNRIH